MKDHEKFELSHKDWIQFLFMIAKHYGINFCRGDWNACENALEEHELDKGLKRVIKLFGDEAFSTDHSKCLPNYKRVRRFINEEINNNRGQWTFSSSKFPCLPN